MIAVTNTTKLDMMTSAGYGDTAIDLGAPGTGIYSTLTHNGYGYKTGTSMATPQVTGSVALIMAAADQEFIEAYKTNPGERILMIKDYLIRSVDPLPSLEGKTVSGGRLNVYKAIQLLLNRPILTTSPNLLHVEIAPNATDEDELNLTNTGNDTLAYKLHIPEDATWLTVSSDTGQLIPSANDMIVVTYNDNGMDTGLYISNIHITTDSAGTKDIPVYMHVTNYVTTLEIGSGPQHVRVSPNPFSNQTKISFYLKESSAVDLTIYDVQGRSVYHKTENISSGVASIPWKGSHVPQGIYFFHLKTNKGFYTGKMVKQ